MMVCRRRLVVAATRDVGRAATGRRGGLFGPAGGLPTLAGGLSSDGRGATRLVWKNTTPTAITRPTPITRAIFASLGMARPPRGWDTQPSVVAAVSIRASMTAGPPRR